jgi:hypothetical protein
MATIAKLEKAVLQDLRMLAAEETPPAYLAAIVRERYLDRLPTLTKDDYADWEAEVIPDEALPGLRLVIAHECARPFGKSSSLIPTPPFRSLEEEGLHKLALYMRIKTTYRPVKATYF